MNEPEKPGLLDKIIEAGSKGGWALALIVGLAGIALAALAIYTRPDVPIVGQPPATNQNVVQELAVEPPLATAYDICLDPSSKFAHFVNDDHYEGQLLQNEGQVNAVRYHLFFRMNPQLDVIIEETRAGQSLPLRMDPNLEQFRKCVGGKKVEEVRPTQ